MTGYEYITKHTSPAQTPAKRGPADIDFIGIHHWDDLNRRPTFDGSVDWQCRPGSQAAGHYTIEAGKVACTVDPEDIAWALGDWAANVRSVSLELNPRASAGDYATAAQIIRELREAYGDMPLRRHDEFTSTSCPGRWNLAKLDKLARAGTAKPKPKPKPKQAKSIKQLADEVIAGKHGNGAARQKSLGSKAAAVQAEVNRRYGAKSIKQLADEVIAGKHGNGTERRQRLGHLYAAVQAEVDRRYA